MNKTYYWQDWDCQQPLSATIILLPNTLLDLSQHPLSLKLPPANLKHPLDLFTTPKLIRKLPNCHHQPYLIDFKLVHYHPGWGWMDAYWNWASQKEVHCAYHYIVIARYWQGRRVEPSPMLIRVGKLHIFLIKSISMLMHNLNIVNSIIAFDAKLIEHFKLCK